MKRVTLIATAVVLAVMALLAGGVAAQETNTSERTFLTFSGTVEMPGLTLQPGTYVFKLADTASRNVVQVWNRDEKDMLGQWLFVQAERPEVTGENVVMFKETPAGTTPAVQYWYFPGEKIGKEFIYPKDQAVRIAKASGVTVLSSEGEVASVSSIDAEGNVTPWQKEEKSSAAASAESVISAEAKVEPAEAKVEPAVQPQPEPAVAVEASPRAQVSADADQPRAVGTSGVQAESQVARADELPRTASPLALSGLIGLLSLAGAAGLRAFRL